MRNVTLHSLLFQTDQYRFFMHCWSLGVEIQFYVLAPFILLPITRLDNGTSVRVCALLATISLLLQLVSDSVIAFNLVFCRIWQFVAGIAAFQISKREHLNPYGYAPVPDIVDRKGTHICFELNTFPITKFSEAGLEELSATSRTLFRTYFALFLGLFTCVLYAPVYLRGLEEYVCIALTACLIAIGSRSDKSTVLTLTPMSLVGDASYMLYLIHWPAIEWYKYQTGTVRFSPLGESSLCWLKCYGK